MSVLPMVMTLGKCRPSMLKGVTASRIQARASVSPDNKKVSRIWEDLPDSIRGLHQHCP